MVLTFQSSKGQKPSSAYGSTIGTKHTHLTCLRQTLRANSHDLFSRFPLSSKPTNPTSRSFAKNFLANWLFIISALILWSFSMLVTIHLYFALKTCSNDICACQGAARGQLPLYISLLMDYHPWKLFTCFWLQKISSPGDLFSKLFA